VELFNRLDGEADLWSGAMMSADETPPWIRFLAEEREEAAASTAKVKPGKAGRVLRTSTRPTFNLHPLVRAYA